ncbi:hypothetical protein [Vibrio parahaemolyticus]|uniref:hypothetical protein n=1 Tax=Vibrio parahaemolyticus TaxID=670 RepID=UPI0004E73D12|nr:hypothetical protein [Vibrio parahaemolyticus]KFE93405.1 hypothetical protein HB39_21970 [Vibrio parahaemolyticus]MBE4095825.1 hypothetical protein [Vibrio parahaemolyticus]MBE4133401.1 hypothetical protein [Vibrio parahaemolyticus]MBX5335971.1 hypothetical protein [Vibrio parahaemolyticus]MCX4128141.1 hypothetical protein [Vibrio parahaemolyticus]
MSRLLLAPSLINYVVTNEVNDRLNKLKDKTSITFDNKWVNEKITIKLAKSYNLTIENNVVLDGNDNDVISEIVGCIVNSILDDKDENIPFSLP